MKTKSLFGTGVVFAMFIVLAMVPATGLTIVKQDQDVPKRDENAATYMEAKLANAQIVLRGLVSENFEEIAEGAGRMKVIAEATHWPTSKDEVYNHYSFEFRRQCDKLIEQAKAEDLRAAHFTYLHLSTTCIDCHDYFRPRFRIERKPLGPAQLIPTEWEGPVRKKPVEGDKDA